MTGQTESTASKEVGKAALDDDTRRMLDRLTSDPFLDPSFSVPQMREAFESFYGAMYADRSPIVDSKEIDIQGSHGSIPTRIYSPRDGAPYPRPLLVFFHGGGSIMGSLDSYDALCQDLCNGSGCIVVAVSYRLAPEHAFSVAVDDCHEATLWAHAHAGEFGGDAGRLAVGGESGGGGLAAIITQIARQEGAPSIKFQMLMYPWVGSRGESQSMREFAKGYFFEAEALEMFTDLNFPNRADLKNWRVAPIWSERFDNLPPAFVLTAGADILRDDAEEYARRLSDAGVPVELSRYDSTIHGFMVMAGEIEVGRRAIQECADKLRMAFHVV
tara:strand:+ start:1729 stop:2715 length:987 start_codon:yes stop_codon:yes gene_type:complete